MTVTLYQSGQQPTIESAEGFSVPVSSTFAQVPPQAAALLGCAPSLVDVLAIGEGYVVYTIFDSKAEVNPAAMNVVSKLTGINFDSSDSDELLRGPVLTITE